MTGMTTSSYDALSRALTYPDAAYAAFAQSLPGALTDTDKEARQALESFASGVQGLSLTEFQELFTRTFDLSPACSLEVGWHLYGEDYARGAFMVSMREQLRRFSVAENGELPDHLTHVLLLVAAMDANERAKFIATYVLPSVRKMVSAMADTDNPYKGVITAVEGVLKSAPGVKQAVKKEEPSHG